MPATACPLMMFVSPKAAVTDATDKAITTLPYPWPKNGMVEDLAGAAAVSSALAVSAPT